MKPFHYQQLALLRCIICSNCTSRILLLVTKHDVFLKLVQQTHEAAKLALSGCIHQLDAAMTELMEMAPASALGGLCYPLFVFIASKSKPTAHTPSASVATTRAPAVCDDQRTRF